MDISTLSDEQGGGSHSHSSTPSLIFERAVGSIGASTGIIENYDMNEDTLSLEDSDLEQRKDHGSINDVMETHITSEEHEIAEVPLTA